MATTITAPSQSSLPRWLLAAVVALCAIALVVGLSMALDSDSDAPATDVTPRSTQVVGSADSIDRAGQSSPRVGSPDSIDNGTPPESSSSRVPSRAF